MYTYVCIIQMYILQNTNAVYKCTYTYNMHRNNPQTASWYNTETYILKILERINLSLGVSYLVYNIASFLGSATLHTPYLAGVILTETYSISLR